MKLPYSLTLTEVGEWSLPTVALPPKTIDPDGLTGSQGRPSVTAVWQATLHRLQKLDKRLDKDLEDVLRHSSPATIVVS